MFALAEICNLSFPYIRIYCRGEEVENNYPKF